MLQLKKNRVLILREELISKLSDCKENADIIGLLTTGDEFIPSNYYIYNGMVEVYQESLRLVNNFINNKQSHKFKVLNEPDQLHLLEIREELLFLMSNLDEDIEYSKRKGMFLAYQESLRLFYTLLPINKSDCDLLNYCNK